MPNQVTSKIFWLERDLKLVKNFPLLLLVDSGFKTDSEKLK